MNKNKIVFLLTSIALLASCNGTPVESESIATETTSSISNASADIIETAVSESSSEELLSTNADPYLSESYIKTTEETLDDVMEIFDALTDYNYAIETDGDVTNILSKNAVYIDYSEDSESYGYSDYGMVDSSAENNDDGYWYFTYDSINNAIVLDNLIYAGNSDSVIIANEVAGNYITDFEASYADSLWETVDGETYTTENETAIHAVLDLGVGEKYADYFEVTDAEFVVNLDDTSITVSYTGTYQSTDYDIEFSVLGSAQMDISMALEDYYTNPYSYHPEVTSWTSEDEYYMNYALGTTDIPFSDSFTYGGSSYVYYNSTGDGYSFNYEDQLSGDVTNIYAAELEDNGWTLDEVHSDSGSYYYINSDETLIANFYFIDNDYITSQDIISGELYPNGLFELSVEAYVDVVDSTAD